MMTDFHEAAARLINPRPHPLRYRAQRRNTYLIILAGSFATYVAWVTQGWVAGFSVGFAYFVALGLCLQTFKQGWYARGSWDADVRDALSAQRVRDPFEGVIIDANPR